MDPRARLAAAALVLLSLASAACSSTPRADPQTLLAQAKAKADRSSSAHFALTSSNVDNGGTNIVDGHGDLVRPDGIQGTFGVTIDGFVANVKVVSRGGVFEALLPFQTHYQKTDPEKYGLTDPAQLLNPATGLTQLLAHPNDPQLGKPERLGGELLDTVSYLVPGRDIPVLPDVIPTQPVMLVAAIDPKSDELRQIALTGPLTTAAHNSTYTLTLTDYNEHVNITLPPT